MDELLDVAGLTLEDDELIELKDDELELRLLDDDEPLLDDEEGDDMLELLWLEAVETDELVDDSVESDVDESLDPDDIDDIVDLDRDVLEDDSVDPDDTLLVENSLVDELELIVVCDCDVDNVDSRSKVLGDDDDVDSDDADDTDDILVIDDWLDGLELLDCVDNVETDDDDVDENRSVLELEELEDELFRDSSRSANSLM